MNNQIENRESLEKEAESLVSRASVIDVTFFMDASRDTSLASSPCDLLEIFERKKPHIQQYYEGQEVEIAYSLAMASMFDGATIDLRNMGELDRENYRYAVNFWKEYLPRFELTKRVDGFHKLIRRYVEDPSEDNRQACLDMICENCRVDPDTAKAVVP